jgi:hypothetical protein
MSDALCGPANPLQQFKQQTQLDRTLQQDRLTSRHSPAQGFRSADPNAGLLDPEFEAFQAGVPPADLSNFPTFQRQPPPSLAGPSQAPSWAADFQRMSLSSPPPFQQQQQPFAPQSSNWAQGFREHIAQTTPQAQQSAPSPQAFQYMARYGSNNYQNNFMQPSFAQPVQQPKGKDAALEVFDDAAFEQAFAQARDALMVEEQRSKEEATSQEPAYAHGASTGNHARSDWEQQLLELEAKNKQRLAMARHAEAQLAEKDKTLSNIAQMETDPVAEQMLREDDSAFHSETEEERMEDAKLENDDDALAQTAQDLLQKVEHNKTDKFRNSQFLGLMRRLADREVRVEGDKMVETVRKHLVPPTSDPDSTYGSGTATPDPAFNNGDFRRLIRTPPPEFDSHFEIGWDEEHEFDHWESPYR